MADLQPKPARRGGRRGVDAHADTDGGHARRPVSRAMTNLLYLMQVMSETPTVGVNEAARRVGIPAANTYRLLKVLEANGFVEQRPDTREYGLTLKLFELGCNSARHTTIRDVAAVEMEYLARELGFAVNLGVLVDRDVLYVEKVQTDEFVVLNLAPGARVPAHCTALGKAILAFGRRDPREVLGPEPLAARTDTSVTTYRELSRQLDETRTRGYAVDCEELAPGVWCVAAPVLHSSGAVLAALSAATVRTHCTEEELEQWGNQTLLAARRIAGRATAFGDQIRVS